MSGPGNSPAAGWGHRILEFLRAELAPIPGRAGAAARIVIATVATTVLVMALHAPHASYAIITVLIVSQANAGASLARAVLRIEGTLLGAATGIVAYVAFVDQPWMRVALLGPLAACFMFLSRTTTAPYFGFLAGITAIMVLTATGSSADQGLQVGLWRIALVLLGAVIGMASQLFLWPGDPEALLLESLIRRLKAVEEIVRARSRGSVADTSRSGALLLTGLSNQLDLLDQAESRHPSLRHRHVEQAALIAGVEQLLTAALAFAHRSDDPPPTVRQRLVIVADRCARVRDALERGQPVGTLELPAGQPAEDPVAHGGGASLLPWLLDLEQSVISLTQAAGFLDPDRKHPGPIPQRLSLDSPERGAFFTPAFSPANTDAILFSLRVGLAATLAYIAYEGLQWPGLSTAVWTTIIVAQATLGASLQKAALRLAGAVIGGGIGLLTIVVLMPVMTGLASLVVVTAVVMALAGWIIAGGQRTSYAGIQIGFAFALSVLNDLGPTTDLTQARDRVMGVLLGILISLLTFQWTGGFAFAGAAMRRSLASVFGSMSDLARVGLCAGPSSMEARPVRGWRWQVYQDLSSTLRLHDESKFEHGAGPAGAAPDRAGVVRLVADAQSAFLSLLALVHHRLTVDLAPAPSDVHQALHLVAGGVVDGFKLLGRRVAEGTATIEFNPGPLLDEARQRLDAAGPGMEPGLRMQLDGRFALYEDLVSNMGRVRDSVNHLGVRQTPALEVATGRMAGLPEGSAPHRRTFGD